MPPYSFMASAKETADLTSRIRACESVVMSEPTRLLEVV